MYARGMNYYTFQVQTLMSAPKEPTNVLKTVITLLNHTFVAVILVTLWISMGVPVLTSMSVL